MVDANGAFDRRAAARWAKRYAEHGVSYVEEPVSSEDLSLPLQSSRITCAASSTELSPATATSSGGGSSGSE